MQIRILKIIYYILFIICSGSYTQANQREINLWDYFGETHKCSQVFADYSAKHVGASVITKILAYNRKITRLIESNTEIILDRCVTQELQSIYQLSEIIKSDSIELRFIKPLKDFEENEIYRKSRLYWARHALLENPYFSNINNNIKYEQGPFLSKPASSVADSIQSAMNSCELSKSDKCYSDHSMCHPLSINENLILCAAFVVK